MCVALTDRVTATLYNILALKSIIRIKTFVQHDNTDG